MELDNNPAVAHALSYPDDAFGDDVAVLIVRAADAWNAAFDTADEDPTLPERDREFSRAQHDLATAVGDNDVADALLARHALSPQTSGNSHR